MMEGTIRRRYCAENDMTVSKSDISFGVRVKEETVNVIDIKNELAFFLSLLRTLRERSNEVYINGTK